MNRREFLFHLSISLCLYIAGLSAPGNSVAQILTRGPYLQLATPTSITVVWRTDAPTNPLLRIGDRPDQLSRQIGRDAIILRVSADVHAPSDVPRLYKEPAEDTAERDPRDDDPSTAPQTYQYEASAAALKSGTRYYYGVFDGEDLLAGGDEDHYFETSPTAGTDANLRIWVVGDSGTGGSDQRLVHEAMQQFVQETSRPLDLYIHVGDMAYGDGTDREFQHNFFDVYQSTLRNTVCWPTMGNHEGHTSRGISGFGPYYDAYVLPTAAEAGGTASGTEAYYSYEIANVHFVCLDSHDLDRKPTGAMAQWLMADLEEARGDWIIAYWHHPPYTKGSHDSDREGQLIEMRTHIMPVLESGGVDVVMAGHSHIYERSMLIDGAYTTPTTAFGVVLDDGDGNPTGDGPYRKSEGLHPNQGTVAIVAGHGGAGLSRKGTMPIMRQIILEHGSVVLDIQGDTLIGTMLNKSGVSRDVFSVVKQGVTTPVRLNDPWQPIENPEDITEFNIDWADDVIGELPARWLVASGDENSAMVQPESNAGRRQLTVVASNTPTVAVYNEYRGELNEYEAWMHMPKDASAAVGLVLGFVDANNYLAYVLDAERNVAQLLQVVDGNANVVTEKPIEVDFGAPIKIELEPVEKLIEVQLNDELEYTLNLDAQSATGQFGVYVAPGGTANFLHLAVEKAR